ncbi:MAG: YciI family protein [Actinomycetes bacterium]
MTVFAVSYRYTDDTATRDRLRPEHRAYLGGLADRGTLLLSGPYGAGEAPGALLLFRAGDKAEVASLLEKDPFAVAGVVADAEVIEWEPVLGPLQRAL